MFHALPSRNAKRVLVQDRESLPSFRRKSSQPLHKLQFLEDVVILGKASDLGKRIPPT